MLNGLFINVSSKSVFQSLLSAGQIAQTQIAFIKDSSEIWTQGKYYNCKGYTDQEIIDLINNNLESLDIDDTIVQSAIQNQVSAWALKENTDTIPLSKIPTLSNDKLPNISEDKLPNELVISGFMSGSTFMKDASTAVTPTLGNIYMDITTNKLYRYNGSEYVTVGGEEVDLSGYAKTQDLATVATSGNYSDLTGTPTIPAAQIQSDWNQTDDTALDFIKNKPNIADILSRLSSLENEVENIWIEISGTEGQNNYYIGMTRPKASNYQTLLASADGKESLGSTLSISTAGKYYLICPSDKKVVATSTAIEGATVNWGVLGTTVDGYDIYNEGVQFGQNIVLNITVENKA